ncbi:MAG TPA: YciI family protein [Ktedonobacterales bacterium]|nr:YciI family protein [Ktedonobacterales bacterium]
MRYALLIYTSAEAETEANAAMSGGALVGHNDEHGAWVAYTRALKDAGALIALERLQSVETATSVRLRGDERLVTDGPFIETKEQLLGFYLIEAPDLDAALDWAARMPHARNGVVEVRPVEPQLPLAQIVAE